jgi:hypothetical protein
MQAKWNLISPTRRLGRTLSFGQGRSSHSIGVGALHRLIGQIGLLDVFELGDITWKVSRNMIQNIHMLCKTDFLTDRFASGHSHLQLAFALLNAPIGMTTSKSVALVLPNQMDLLSLKLRLWRPDILVHLRTRESEREKLPSWCPQVGPGARPGVLLTVTLQLQLQH